MVNRRGLITGLISFIAAPAVIRSGLLMPIKSITEKMFTLADYERMLNELYAVRINELQKKIADQIFYSSDNVRYFGGLKYFMHNDRLEVKPVKLFMVDK